MNRSRNRKVPFRENRVIRGACHIPEFIISLQHAVPAPVSRGPFSVNTCETMVAGNRPPLTPYRRTVEAPSDRPSGDVKRMTFYRRRTRSLDGLTTVPSGKPSYRQKRALFFIGYGGRRWMRKVKYRRKTYLPSEMLAVVRRSSPNHVDRWPPGARRALTGGRRSAKGMGG
jgi:hypothetical protein